MTVQPPTLSGAAPSLERALSREQRRAALVARAPWLEPLLDRLGRDVLDPALGAALERCLRQFEELPGYALSAIGTLLQEESRTPRQQTPELGEAAEPGSSDKMFDHREALQSDPAFALALHCVDARLRPRLALAAASPALSRVPEEAWFGLLQTSARSGPLLTPAVSVLLVLRVSSANYWLLPHTARTAALRLFSARAADLRAERATARLCAELPAAWAIDPAAAEPFVAAAAEARAGFAEACTLCERLAASARTRARGLAALELSGAQLASPSELADLRAAALRSSHVRGYTSLLQAL